MQNYYSRTCVTVQSIISLKMFLSENFCHLVTYLQIRVEYPDNIFLISPQKHMMWAHQMYLKEVLLMIKKTYDFVEN